MASPCRVAGRCAGCPEIGRPYEDQLASKRARLVALAAAAGVPLPVELPILSAGEDGLRDRVDLTFSRDAGGGTTLGLYDLTGEALVDVGPCPALSPALRAFVQALAVDPPPPPVTRASLRLRVAPDGRRGLWIDAAHVDVKALFDEGAWLERRLADAAVEIGQRRKPLEREEARLRLRKAPSLAPWFHTWVAGRPVPLYGPVAGFSQPSHVANRLLVGEVDRVTRATGARRILELGAGQGNFTLPLAAQGLDVLAAELDPLAREGLVRSARELGLAPRIELCELDVQRDTPDVAALLDGIDAVLADPPRSGLRGFVEALGPARPALVYVSCFVESLATDLARLAALGYAVVEAVAVDQFPQTPHLEWIVRLAPRAP